MILSVKDIKEPLTSPPSSPSNSSDESSESEELSVPAKRRKTLYCFLTHCIIVFYLCISITEKETLPLTTVRVPYLAIYF